MKKKIVIALLLCLLVSLTSCETFKDGFKGAGVTTALKARDYEVLGPVTMDSNIKNILFFFTFGGKGYEEFLEKAKAEYPGCDAVIDIYEDFNSAQILLVYNAFKHRYMGTAIKYI